MPENVTKNKSTKINRSEKKFTSNEKIDIKENNESVVRIDLSSESDLDELLSDFKVDDNLLKVINSQP